MPDLVKIKPDLFPRLYDAFLHDDDPLSDENDWRNVFDYQWNKDEDHTGYALIENDKVIGMMAMAFSERLIDGRTHKFCNLHTWWVHEDHRGRSLAMLRPLLGLQDYTITHFTPCDRIRAVTERLGFVELSLEMKVLLPIRPSAPPSAAQVLFDGEFETSILSGHDRKIFDDHQPYRVENAIIRDGETYCYVLYTTVERYRVRYCHIHYISNRSLYAQAEAAVRTAMMQRHKVWFVVLEARLVRDLTFRRSFNFWAPAHAVFRPAHDISAHHVDNLYSDVVMLRLAIMPHVSHELKKLIRRWLPGGDSALSH